MQRPDHLIFALALALFAGAAVRDALDRWISSTALPPLVAETSTTLHGRDGTLLRVLTVEDGRWRLPVAPGAVDRTYLDMLIAYEDGRFYRHRGIDVLALLRATGQALWHGRIVSGGSTLTMQVARLLEDSGTGHWRGKLRQMRVALALERRLSKREILSLYLARAPFGGNLEGVRAAALAWFGKPPARLTPAEAALLVALPQSPEARRPDRYPAVARKARDRVLARMAGDGVIGQDNHRVALSEPVPVSRRAFPSAAPHLTDRAARLAPNLGRHDLTIDGPLQSRLERLARVSLRGLPDRLSIAILVADHGSGEILASVGSGGYSAAGQGFVDMTRAPRSPGSILKPLIYGMAFDRGHAHPETLIADRPTAFGQYAPQNFDGRFMGTLTAAEALRLSRNIPAVMLADQIGPGHLMSVLRRAGLDPRLPGARPGLAVALGGVGLSLVDLVQLYATLANGGQARPLYWRADALPPPGSRVIGRAAAWQVGDVLSGLAPPPGARHGALAYKTGTSYGHRDAWALGYDGRHVAGVWIGRPDGTPVPGAFGGDLAAPVLFDAFQRLKPAFDPLPPPPPETLILPTADLPPPLRRFTARGAAFGPAPNAPKLAFPPDGAHLPLSGNTLPVKVRNGIPPFTWMADGRPLLTGVRRRETALPGLEKGFSILSVIDARGRAARVSVRLD